LANTALRIAFIGNALPRRCGIATFTTDLERALHDLGESTAIAALNDPLGHYAYPPQVRWHIAQDDAASYRAAAHAINTQGYDVACLQHEFGIFGGEAGEHVLALVGALQVPLVTTLHTVLDQPSPAQRRVMQGLLAASAMVVVMADKGRRILIDTYGADPSKLAIIPHGIPDMPLIMPAEAKMRLGLGSHSVILTFGLISPNKGIETMIEAMPHVLAAAPDAVYVVMGATHPSLLSAAGEAYRDGLIARVHDLGLDGHVVFINRFVDRAELLDHIALCDVYVTPYLVEAQLTSGTLAISHGLGRPVVSTPYWHAAQLLADGSGVLVPFGQPAAMGAAVADLLRDAPARLAMGTRAYAASRDTTWANTALHYRAVFMAACHHAAPLLPPAALTHFRAMTDDTGLFQHAVYGLPDRHHGYCVDDNARALLVACGNAQAWPMAQGFAAFIQHAWNPDTGRFRNFMSFERRWLEPTGSQDSHGRTLWALGVCAANHSDALLARWAGDLFRQAMEVVASFTSPRAWAFTLLGLDAYCATRPHEPKAQRLRMALAERLAALLHLCQSADWIWFEDRLTYDNARLPQALMLTGMATGASHLTQAGLASLRWLLAMQTSPATATSPGHFRPVGSNGFLLVSRGAPMAFDQQPVEACATIAACLAAQQAQPDVLWPAHAHAALAWFLGRNDLGLPLVDVPTGSCRDGLHPDRANENRGAESVVSWLLALADMHTLANLAPSLPTAAPSLLLQPAE
jgi:glycosyltransferase involved in cell wall biosynthesis